MTSDDKASGAVRWGEAGERRLPVVYILDGSVARTGAYVCASNIARALAGRARVVLVLPGHSAISAQEAEGFAAVQRLPIRMLRRSPGAVLAYLPALLAASAILRWRLRRDRAAVLIVNDFYHMHGAVCRLLGFRGRVLTWVRIAPAAFGRRVSGVWLRLAAASSDRLVAVSRHIQGLMPPGLRTELLYDALDPMPAASARPAAAESFAYVGNYIAGKGQDNAIEAFAALAAEFPGLELRFYGGDMGLDKNRAYRAALEARAAQLGLAERIHFHGFVPDPIVAIDGALAALNFSASESFSMTVLEAQGAGVPVIATRSGGPAEIILDGETGLLLPVGDIPAMTAAMRALASDPARAREMGQAARRRVSTAFSAERFRGELLELLDLGGDAGEAG
jgi:glycosyltransferase involved in cell wall biosynthesis